MNASTNPPMHQYTKKSYGLPQIQSIPDNFSPLVEIWGKGSNRDPLLVQFSHPIDWVVTLPSQDVNGEDGTIQAGEYAKGDTATFYVLENGRVEVRQSERSEVWWNLCFVSRVLTTFFRLLLII